MSILVAVKIRRSEADPWTEHLFDLAGTRGLCVGDHPEGSCAREDVLHLGGAPSRYAADLFLGAALGVEGRALLQAGYRSTQPDWMCRRHRGGGRLALRGRNAGRLGVEPGDELAFGALDEVDGPSFVRIRVMASAEVFVPRIPPGSSGLAKDEKRQDIVQRLRRGLLQSRRVQRSDPIAIQARAIPLLAVLAFELPGRKAGDSVSDAVTAVLGADRNNLSVQRLRRLLIRFLDDGDGVGRDRRDRMLTEVGLPEPEGTTISASLALADGLRQLGVLEEPVLIEHALRVWCLHLVRTRIVPEDIALAAALAVCEASDASLDLPTNEQLFDALLPEFEAALSDRAVSADPAVSWARLRRVLGGRLSDTLELSAPGTPGARGVLTLARDIARLGQGIQDDAISGGTR